MKRANPTNVLVLIVAVVFGGFVFLQSAQLERAKKEISLQDSVIRAYRKHTDARYFTASYGMESAASRTSIDAGYKKAMRQLDEIEQSIVYLQKHQCPE